MPKNVRNNATIRKILVALAIIIGVALLVYLIVHGRHYFNRVSLRQMQTVINSYGSWSPVAIIFLIVISTVIPPLPIPIMLIEIAAGLIFGFGNGFLLVWISQIIASLAAFIMTRIIGKSIFRRILENRIFNFYRRYIHNKGPLAVFMIRATMASPLNVVSFLAGLTQMHIIDFTIATILGTIPEALLFSYIGSLLQHTHLRLWYIFVLIVLLSALGPVFMYLESKYLNPDGKK
jgi:uncharacterized membrane protein YdjX (TVP38/TMEM64 family)